MVNYRNPFIFKFNNTDDGENHKIIEIPIWHLMADINIHSLHAYLGSHFDGRHLQSRNNLNFCYFLDKFTHNVKVSLNQGQKCRIFFQKSE